MWQKIIDFFKSKGHVGEIVAKLLNKYKSKIEEMLKKILKTEAKELIKLIDEIKEDIIKIIKGGHIDVNLANDEEVIGNPIDDCECFQFLSMSHFITANKDFTLLDRSLETARKKMKNVHIFNVLYVSWLNLRFIWT